MKSMNRDFSAFRAKLSSLLAIGIASSVIYEKREEPTIKSVADSIDKIATAFEEYKKTNDGRIEAIKNGKSTTDFDAKLAKIDEHINGLSEAKSRLEKIEAKLARPGVMTGSRQDGETKEDAEYRSAFLDWVRSPTDPECQQRATQAQKALDTKRAEGLGKRSAQVVTSSPSSGGLALPRLVEQEIARLGVDISPMRKICRVRQVGTTDYRELFDVNGAGFEWIGETDTRNQTNTPDLQEVIPFFGMASAKPQASEESLDDLFFNVEDWLISSASESMALGEGAAFVGGNGVKKPKGFLAGPAPVTTADATRTFGTLQYIASGQAAALPTNFDLFYDIVYSLRARYRANATWVTNKLILASMRKYKDGQGQYLWQPSAAAGQPATFLGYGIEEVEDMPSLAANAFPLAFGDFKEGYLITDRVGLRMTRDEVTTPGFVKFYVRKRVGGVLRNTQAIKLLKIAAA